MQFGILEESSDLLDDHLWTTRRTRPIEKYLYRRVRLRACAAEAVSAPRRREIHKKNRRQSACICGRRTLPDSSEAVFTLMLHQILATIPCSNCNKSLSFKFRTIGRESFPTAVRDGREFAAMPQVGKLQMAFRGPIIATGRFTPGTPAWRFRRKFAVCAQA